MNENSDNSELASIFQDVPSNMAGFQLPPCDYIEHLDVDFDIDLQLMAIRRLLRRNSIADKSLSDEIKALDRQARHSNVVEAGRAADEWLDQIVYSTYQDAAHSMSAVGMLAPLIETIFHQCFQGIGKLFYPAIQPSKTHERWSAAHSIQWDCHFVVAKGRIHKDIVKGIFQLSDAVGLSKRFPSDLKAVLLALFTYRNKMFHNGFEWPVDERQQFAKKIKDEGWPSAWFSVATTNDNPWIFFMSDNFIQHCDKTIELVLDAIGCFVRDELLPKGTSL